MVNEVMEYSTSTSLSSSHSASPLNKIHSPSSPLTSQIKPSSNVAKVIQMFKNYRDRGLKEWTEVKLKPNEFEELESLLTASNNLFDYVNGKIRYEKHMC